jgi:hypothetical protein
MRAAGDGVFGRDRTVGFDSQAELVEVEFLPDAGIVDLVGNLTHRRVERVDRNETDRRINRTPVLTCSRDIALAGVGGQFHVEGCTFVEVANHEVLVHDLDIAGHGDVTRSHFARAGGRELKTLGPSPCILKRDLLDVENDVGDVFTDTSQATNSCSTFSMRIEVTAAP